MVELIRQSLLLLKLADLEGGEIIPSSRWPSIAGGVYHSDLFQCRAKFSCTDDKSLKHVVLAVFERKAVHLPGGAAKRDVLASRDGIKLASI